jgi:cytochrome c peroxidase
MSIRFRQSSRIGWVIAVFLLQGCEDGSRTTVDEGITAVSAFAWNIPAGTPLPVEPVDNPMTEAGFQLGRHLFYDNRLSGNGTQACASCHLQERAFTDGATVAIGSTGELHPRNSQSLVNVAYNATLTWANSSLRTLEQQIVIPLFGESPVEQGLNDANRESVLQLIREEPVYEALFSAAFPDEGDPVNFGNIVYALASFVRGIVSFNSPFDRFERGDPTALTVAAQRGRALFFSEDLECFHCHGGYNLSDSTTDRTQSFVERPFHNTGLFNIAGTGAYPDNNQGIFEITGDPSDMGAFRAPSLRNVALTAPYLHDGSAPTLGDVIRIYAAGGRNITSGPNTGDGRSNPFKDGFITGFALDATQEADLIAFLHSLTDDSLINNSRFANPWVNP